MIEQLEQLESRVDALAKALETARAQNDQAAREIEELQGRVATTDSIKQQNQDLEAQIQRLEGEIEQMAEKESKVRQKLRSIMERIDTVENAVAAPGADGAL